MARNPRPQNTPSGEDSFKAADTANKAEPVPAAGTDPAAPAGVKSVTPATPENPTPPSADGAISDGGRRVATVRSRIDHDGEVYLADDVIFLTEAEFVALQLTGALVEGAWDDCAEI